MVNLLSDLTLGAPLGSGAFGTVYMGQDPAHGTVAVKVLTRLPAWNDTEWDRRRTAYLKEAQNLSKATHDHVVKVHHIVATDDGQAVQICMAFCQGGSLQAAFDNGPTPLPIVRNVATDVLLGLGALHARGMLHRDIKPANILLNEAGKALIGDFGLVTDEIVLGYGSDAGYCDHLAYEVWQGKGTSERTDVWALGATIYRLLHGKVWYEESPDPASLIVGGGFADGLRWLPHIPKKWRRFIRQMMEDDTTKRFQTANQALSALSKLPVVPAWVATVGPTVVRWELIAGKRRKVVEWKRGRGKNEWVAWSESLESGQKKKLGGSGGVVPVKQAVAGLEAFLATA
jgi:serine/threonine protein kinase